MESYESPTPENRLQQPEEKDPRLMLAARILSAIFTPFMVPFVGFFLLFFFTYLRIMPLQYKLIMLGIVYCFTILMPMLFIYLYQKLSGEGLRALGERKKRFVPYVLTLTSYLACLFTLYRLHLPRYLSGILVAALLCMIGCTLLNFRWKVSTHTASSGLLIGGLLSYSFLFQFNPVGWLSFFILLAGMLGSARIIVKQHTLGEVFTGFVIGLFCGVIGILFI